jgi:hypothetical protein
MHHFADPDWAGYNSPAAEDGSIAVGALALISETRCDVDQAPGRHLELLSDQSSLWVIEAVNGNIRMLINRGRGYQNLRYLLLKAKRMAVANIEFISVQTVKKAA